MRIKLEDKIEHHLTPLIQDKWDRLVEETGTSKLSIPEEIWALLRVFFQLGYQEGHDDMFEQIKEIYFTDVDCFIEMFEKDEGEIVF